MLAGSPNSTAAENEKTRDKMRDALLLALVAVVLAAAKCEMSFFDGSDAQLETRRAQALKVFPGLLDGKCDATQGLWEWRLEGTGFHRHLHVRAVNCTACASKRLLLLLGLSRGLFVDPFESPKWITVPGEPQVDLETRADSAAAHAQLIAVESEVGSEQITVPVHFRYPAVAVDHVVTAEVLIDCLPSVWIEGGCELQMAEENQPVLSATIPCGREQDVWWVVSVTVATAVLGCVILISRMSRAIRKEKLS